MRNTFFVSIFASVISLGLWLIPAHLSAQNTDKHQFPFSTDSTHITVWNGEYYSPLFIKGVNLGVSVPGTFPGQLAATREQYAVWFQQIRDAGFNTIRAYTLHFPRFYEELEKFNRANPNHPIYVFHGVWLEEELPGYDEDLFSLTETFDQETEDNVRSIHGDHSIEERRGKAYGNYTADISEWVIGYIMGREIHPPEVIHTNSEHPDVTSYSGNYLSIDSTNASEAWLTERMDHLLTFEMNEYNTQRPISASSWPTLDPLDHPFEQNEYEDSAEIDVSSVDFCNAAAGFFASYHAYPYYPNFVSQEPNYTPFSDHLGQNSYLGYLTFLKQHYPRFPLIIAEFGGSSSWGVAQYAHNGIHHGGYSERKQGEYNLRLLRNISASGSGGGVAFSWIDEWFKQTWITNPLDNIPGRRIIWHNLTAAEQNFGLIGFQKPETGFYMINEFADSEPILRLRARADYSLIEFRLDLPEHIKESDTVWVGLDTYDSALGESVLPNGETVQNRAEFALMITNYEAKLFVTKAYDTFGIWHGTSDPDQLYRSIPTDGGKWELVRWKNDQPNEEVQPIGNLEINRLDMPEASTDGVRLKEDHILIRLPWYLMNYTDPSQRRVLHDDRSTEELETRISTGINLSVFYGDFSYETTGRYAYPVWNHVLDVEQFTKQSYYVMQEHLPELPGNPIAKSDEFLVAAGAQTTIASAEGLLINDLSLDGTELISVLEFPPNNGSIHLRANGGFDYDPGSGFTGEDAFTYRVKAGFHWSDPVSVQLQVEGEPRGEGFTHLFPNPAYNNVTITSPAVIDRVEIYNVLGQKVFEKKVSSTRTQVSVTGLASGMYFARIHSARTSQTRKFVRVK